MIDGATPGLIYGLPAVERFIQEGYCCCRNRLPRGLGAGGAHQYAIATTQARDVINSIRAAGALGVSEIDKKAADFVVGRQAAAQPSRHPGRPIISRKRHRLQQLRKIVALSLSPRYRCTSAIRRT